MHDNYIWCVKMWNAYLFLVNRMKCGESEWKVVVNYDSIPVLSKKIR